MPPPPLPSRRIIAGLWSFARASALPPPIQIQPLTSPYHDASSLHPWPPPRPCLPAEDPPAAFVRLLKASSRAIKSVVEAELLHSRAVKSGLGQDDRARTGLLHLYAKCGCLDPARKVFGEMHHRGVLAWTILISAHSRVGQWEEGMDVFADMLAEGTPPNRVTLSCVLKCCAACDDLGRGKSTHCWIIRNGIELDVVLQNSILDFYAKCGTFGCSKSVFQAMAEKDAISWNIMIGAHLRRGDVDGSMELFKTSPYQDDVSSWNTVINGQMESGCHAIALQILRSMVDKGPAFGHFTFSIALVLASRLAMVDLGKELHCRVLRIGYDGDAFIRNALLDMYSKCGDMEASLFFFSSNNNSPDHGDGSIAETIFWSSMIAGHVQNGMDEEALKLLCRMFQDGVKVDHFTLTSIAAACSNPRFLEQGKQVHCCVEKLGHKFDVFLACAITDMYAKCGNLEDARNFFDNTLTRNVVLWTSMIGAYSSHGRAAEAIEFFQKMLDQKIVPNEVSFVHVLSACAHAGLVEKGYAYFRSMQEEHGISPSIEHYTCMVDLLGRAGLLEKARGFIQEKCISNYPVVWKALLSSCQIHNDIEMASWVAEQLVQLVPCDSGHYVLLSNIYSSKRRWEEASKLRSTMHDRGVRKNPGQSWIQ